MDWSVCELYLEFLIFARPAKIKELMRQKNTRDVSIIYEQTFALCRESKVGLPSICAVGAFGDTCRRQLLALSTEERVYVRFLDGRKMLPDWKVTHSPGV